MFLFYKKVRLSWIRKWLSDSSSCFFSWHAQNFVHLLLVILTGFDFLIPGCMSDLWMYCLIFGYRSGAWIWFLCSFSAVHHCRFSLPWEHRSWIRRGNKGWPLHSLMYWPVKEDMGTDAISLSAFKAWWGTIFTVFSLCLDNQIHLLVSDLSGLSWILYFHVFTFSVCCIHYLLILMTSRWLVTLLRRRLLIQHSSLSIQKSWAPCPNGK